MPLKYLKINIFFSTTRNNSKPYMVYFTANKNNYHCLSFIIYCECNCNEKNSDVNPTRIGTTIYLFFQAINLSHKQG